LPLADLAYVDASAFVKLILPEPETAALVAALERAGRAVASELLEVEALRATSRAGSDLATARAQLEAVRLVPLSTAIRATAAELRPPSMRSLDAVHVATALNLRERLTGLYTYDERMARAAEDVGLDVYAPR
jgi:predicted nucleic acid-binding protein